MHKKNENFRLILHQSSPTYVLWTLIQQEKFHQNSAYHNLTKENSEQMLSPESACVTRYINSDSIRIQGQGQPQHFVTVVERWRGGGGDRGGLKQLSKGASKGSNQTSVEARIAVASLAVVAAESPTLAWNFEEEQRIFFFTSKRKFGRWIIFFRPRVCRSKFWDVRSVQNR